MDFKEIREKSIKLAKKQIKESVSKDNYIVHAINNIEDLAKVTNGLTKRLRWWYDLYIPEFSRKIIDNETFVKLVLKNDRKNIMNEMKLKESMGKDLDPTDLKPILALASRINSLYDLRDELKIYLDQVMSKYCKNLYAITGSLLGAKLLEEAGSLKKVAMMPSSTIPLLGAEKALFRHLKTGARPPKHGLILQHPLLANAKKANRGKAARLLADKINLAIKTDYFKGAFIGDKLRKELEAKLK